MKRLLYLFFILFAFYANGYAQQSDFHKKIINAYDRIEIDDRETTSIDEIKKLAEQSRKSDFQQGVLRGLTMLQKIAVIQNDYILSGKYSNEAEPLATQLKNYEALSAIYLYRGKIKIILDKYPEAEADLNTSLEYAEKIEDVANKHIQLCRIYANFSGMYEGKEDYKNWYITTKKSLDIIRTTPTKNLTEYQKSKYYYLYIFELMNMGSYYVYGQKPPDFKTAEPYFIKMLSFQSSAPEYFKLCAIDVYYALSSFYYDKKDYQQSLDYAFKLLEAEKSKNSPRDRLFAYNYIKDSYGALNNRDQETKYLRLYTALNDSINFVEKRAIVNQSREHIQKSDVKHKESRRLLLWIGSIAILMIALGVWLLVRRNNKILRRNYEQMIAKLRSEVAPISHQAEELNGKTADDEMETEWLEESETSVQKTIISAETEARILKRLSSFERSERFLRKDMTIGLLSAQLNTNSKYLSEIIRNNRSQNFSHYINTLRINYIVHKLYNEPKYREYKISYLAEECGFASPQVFVLAFKKINGVTPSYFIDKLKQDKAIIYS